MNRRLFLATASSAATVLSCPTWAQAVRYVQTPAELAAALASALPGDNIVLADAIFKGDFKATRGGTAAAPVTIRAENRLRPVVAGTIAIQAPFVAIDGLKFQQGATYAVTILADDVSVLRCWFAAARGITLKTQQRWTIANNRFSGNPEAAARADHIFIDLPVVSSKLPTGLIARNHFTHTKTSDGSESHHVYIGPSDSSVNPTLSGIVIEYNLVDRSARRRGLYVKRGVVIRHNHIAMSRGVSFFRHGDGGILWGNRFAGVNRGKPVGIINGKNHDIRGNAIEGGAVLQLMAEHLSKTGNRYQAADDALLAGNAGPVVVGHVERGGTLQRPVSGVRIFAHAGAITMKSQVNTLVQASATGITWPPPVTLTASQVGPEAAA